MHTKSHVLSWSNPIGVGESLHPLRCRPIVQQSFRTGENLQKVRWRRVGDRRISAPSRASTGSVAKLSHPRILHGGLMRGSAPKVTTKRHEPTSVIFLKLFQTEIVLSPHAHQSRQPGRRRAGGGGMRPRCASICDVLRRFAPAHIFNFCTGGAMIGCLFDA